MNPIPCIERCPDRPGRHYLLWNVLGWMLTVGLMGLLTYGLCCG